MGGGLVAVLAGGNELVGEGLHQGSELVVVGQAAVGDTGQQGAMAAPGEVEQLGLEAMDIGDLDVVEETAGAGVEDHDLLLDRHWRVETLLQELGEAVTPLELGLRHSIEIGTEGGERLELTELLEVGLECSHRVLHGLHLGGRAHTGHRDPDVDRRSHTRLEQVVLKEDLPVGDGDHVGGNVGRDVAGLGLDDR